MSRPWLAALRAGRAATRAWTCSTTSRCRPAAALRALPNLVLTPHLGYCVTETLPLFYAQSIENAQAFLDGKPIRVVNPEVL